MITDLEQLTTFFLFGVPRSGTTIIANFLNSLEDGFCLGEPFWYIECNGIETLERCCGKVAALWKNNRIRKTDILTKEEQISQIFIPYVLFTTRYKLGGFKETFRITHPRSIGLVYELGAYYDYNFIVLRDPVKVLSSQHALGWQEWDDPDLINQSYHQLNEMARNTTSSVLVLEDFVLDPVGYMNERLPFKVSGEFYLRATGHAFGDPLGNMSTEVYPSAPDSREICIPDEWIERLEPSTKIWEYWRKNSALPIPKSEVLLDRIRMKAWKANYRVLAAKLAQEQLQKWRAPLAHPEKLNW